MPEHEYDVLAIDKSGLHLSETARLLAQHGLPVNWHTATGLSGAEDPLLTEALDAVLFGCGAPDTGVLEALSAVQEHDPNLPFILVSDHIGEEQAVEFIKCGVWDFVLKGDVARLVSAIRQSRIKAEHLRVRQREEKILREREEHYRLLADNSEDFVALNHVDGRRLYLSPSYYRATGWTPEEIRSTDWRSRLHPDERTLIEQTREANLRGETTCIEHRVLCKNGSWLWVENRCRPLLGPDGKVEKMLIWSRDITERKQAQAKHDLLLTQFLQAQKMEAVGRLAGGVAHDFNNILQTILCSVHSLELSTEPNDPKASDLKEIAKAVQRSADLTRQLLAFARKQLIAPKVLDLNESISDTLSMLRRTTGKAIALVWHPADDLWPVKVDPSQLNQILVNLVVNARDAIGARGQITIETGKAVLDEAYCLAHPSTRAGDYVKVSVSDDGCGMDAKTQARLFEPFFTTKGEGLGTGLGLATVYGIVSQNQGSIDVTSEPGNGSTFAVYLPRHTCKTEKKANKPDGDSASAREAVAAPR